MVKFILCVIFMILIFDWWMIFYSLLFLSFMFILVNSNVYASSLSYSYGFDMLSYWMILLTFWVISLMIMASYNVKLLNNYSLEFLLVVLFLLLFLLLSFSCVNLFYFYLWFESSMVPTMFLIFSWGYQPERLLAGMYLIFYTLFASFPLLLCIFYINNVCGTLFYYLISVDYNFYLNISLMLAFLVKMPMFFTHFWLPKAHVEAPVSGSMILAGVLLKLGGYGLYRVFSFFSFSSKLNSFPLIISLFGMLIISLLCLCQVDIKSMIAYSSVAHMGLVIGGLMTCNSLGLWGSLVMMIGHGLCSSGMFALANFLYERTHSRSIMINSGFILFMPNMSMMWFMLSINNMSSPPSLNFLGEIMLIKSLISWSGFSILFLSFSSFLSCCYSIYLYSITQHGVMYGGLSFISCGTVREYILIFYHWLPLNILFMKSDLFTLWL
uniref:NADH-ubiquinone oxidoreductase chain 4 n=1 Tax=Bryanellocoris orientalis TaxID=2813430 RepID=A0A8T9W3M3_9HEMI|nr:NADH dehydrogenase subunit 4 [Bryanellocoris orientalis]UPI55320.1 NADH dehydrogenase subunit 4 [Bryanellocoris orientalis]